MQMSLAHTHTHTELASLIRHVHVQLCRATLSTTFSLSLPVCSPFLSGNLLFVLLDLLLCPLPVASCQKQQQEELLHLLVPVQVHFEQRVDHFSWSFEVFILIYLHKIFMHSGSVCVSLSLSLCLSLFPARVCEQSHLM